MDVLSRVVLRGWNGDFRAPTANHKEFYSEVEFVSALSEDGFRHLLTLAANHHVTIRALTVIQKAAATCGNAKVVTQCENVLADERARIAHAIESLAPVCRALEGAGAKTTVIKSLDHLPDLGSDLDLYTSGDERTVLEVMTNQFQAERQPRSWGDRLANKWNFKVPDIPELIEIHVQYLGQTGEHKAMARRVIERRVTRTINDHVFRVPAPEERIIISTLQRIYRHFYFRLCDMAEVAALIQREEINFPELRRAANAGGVWPGVATFLLLVSEYVKAYGGVVNVPREVLAEAFSPGIRVNFRSGFLRVPLGPAAGLFGSQWLSASKHRDFRAMFRLPLLPPLAVSAAVAYRLTGSDKGIW